MHLNTIGFAGGRPPGYRPRPHLAQPSPGRDTLPQAASGRAGHPGPQPAHLSAPGPASLAKNAGPERWRGFP